MSEVVAAATEQVANALPAELAGERKRLDEFARRVLVANDNSNNRTAAEAGAAGRR
ncbi:hypothetical protein PLANPX_0842 [Lacipirellula parvula]|uniref:Uncharacterized protein n=1 Tax=Lacipirellula parvula TaxID=2650471 RepID=A0A5K7X3X6_9BACT|nr:hypothetical protein PLANPX_0842 [Lacipirellula parvula]